MFDETLLLWEMFLGTNGVMFFWKLTYNYTCRSRVHLHSYLCTCMCHSPRADLFVSIMMKPMAGLSHLSLATSSMLYTYTGADPE